MFTGIIKAMSPVVQVTEQKGELKIQIKKPKSPAFLNLKAGDSVAVDGVCLSLENTPRLTMNFHLGYETLQITQWKKSFLQNKLMNLEPALKLGDFVGGHFVSGHAEGLAKVINRKDKSGGSVLLSLQLKLKEPILLKKKSFIALNGVSLTINKAGSKKRQYIIEVCLIPETLKRSNLSLQKTGSYLTFELPNTAGF